MDLLSLISKILIIILLLAQIILMCYLFYINKKTFERERKCWNDLDEKIKQKYTYYLNANSEKNIKKS